MTQDLTTAAAPTHADVTRTCVLVLGAHRSGTSALTRLLNIHGCDLPTTLMPPSLGNTAGHWESQAIADFDDELLDSAGSRWDDVQPVADSWYVSPRLQPLLDQAGELLGREFGQSPLFALKDPRICRIAPFWLRVLEAQGIAPAIVLPIRHPEEVAGSLERRDDRPGWYGQMLWLRHVLDAERATRGRNRVFSSFAGLRADWRGQIGAIAQRLGLHLPRVSPLSAAEADQFIAPRRDDELVGAPVAGLTGRADVTSWVGDTFFILDRWAVGGERDADHAALDRIRSGFDAAVSAFGAFLLPSRTVGGADQGARQRADLKQALTAREQELGALREQAAQVQVDTGLQERLAGSELAQVALNEELAQLEKGLRDAERAGAELAGQLAEREAAQAQAVQRAAEADAARQAAEAEAARLAAEVVQHIAQADVDRQAAQAASARLEAEVARLQLEAARIVLAEHASAALVEQLRERDAQREQTAAAIGQMQQTIDYQDSRLRQYEEESSQYLAELTGLREGQATIAALAGKLSASEAWVFRLAGQRRTLELENARLDSHTQRREQQALRLLRQLATQSEAAEQERLRNRSLIDALQVAATGARAEQQTRIDVISAEVERLRAREQELGAAVADEARQSLERHEQLAIVRQEVAVKSEAMADISSQLVEHAAQRDDKQWLLETSAMLVRAPSWWRFLPDRWRRRYEHERLRKAGLFDAEAYVSRYPDVASEGMDPLRHYLVHGIEEGRERPLP